MTQADRTIGVGIAGLGFMGMTHARAYTAARKNGYPCRIVAVCDEDQSQLTAHKQAGGNILPADDRSEDSESLIPQDARRYQNLTDMLADGAVDLVSICTYTDTHATSASAALRAGKHVLLEKPVALSSKEAEVLRKEAERHSASICIPAMCIRFWPGWSEVKKLVESGAYGKPCSAKFERLGALPDWGKSFYSNDARTGGAILDLHIHDVDFLTWCLGTPTSIRATGSTRHLSAQFEYAGLSGPFTIEGGWIDIPGFSFHMRYRFEFERASLSFDSSADVPFSIQPQGIASLTPFSPLTGYDVEIRHMLDLIRGATQEARATLAEAVQSLRIIEAEKQSLTTGNPVSPPFHTIG